MIQNNSILLISNEPWGDIWFSKHHYANELSANNDVYFIDPPKGWSLSSLFSNQVEIEVINERLKVVRYSNSLPTRFFPKLFTKINDFFNSKKLEKALLNNKKNEDVIVWQFDIFRFLKITFHKPFKRIFHVVDPYIGFTQDFLIAKHSDLIVILGEAFRDYYKDLNDQILVIPHGVSANEFLLDENKVKEIKSDLGKFFLFLGTINYHTNFDLLDQLTMAFPDYNTVILGGVVESDTMDWEIDKYNALLKKDNFRHIPPVPGNMVKNFVAASDIPIIPYLRSDIDPDRHRNSLKLINYLAQNKAFVSSLLHDVLYMNEKVGFFTADNETFIDSCKKIVAGEFKFDQVTSDQFLEPIKYTNLISKIMNKLEGID